MIQVTYKHFCGLCCAQLGPDEEYESRRNSPLSAPSRRGAVLYDDYLCDDCMRPVNLALKKRKDELEAAACE